MKTRGAASASIALAVLASSLYACGASFKAVDAAGKTGAKIGDQATAIDAWDRACETLHALNEPVATLRAEAVGEDASAFDADCRTWRAATAKIRQIALALAAYSVKLSAVANGKDLNFGSPQFAAISAIGVSGWTSDATNSKIVTAVVQLFSEAYRKAALQDVIKAMAKPLDDAVAELDAASRLADAKLDLVASALHASKQAIALDVLASQADAGARGYAPPLAGLLLEEVRKLEEDAADQRAATAALRTAVDAFGEAHRQLVAHARDLDSDDATTAVVDALGGAFTGAKN